MKKIDHLSGSQKAKLSLAGSLYNFYNYLQKVQERKIRQQGSREHMVVPQLPGQGSSAGTVRKLKTTSWADVMKGVDVLTTKGMPRHHFPGMLNVAKAATSMAYFPLGYSLKHRLSREGMRQLAQMPSPFYKLAYPEVWITDTEFTLRFLQGPLPNLIRKCRPQDRVFSNLPTQLFSELTGATKESAVDACYVIDFSIFDGLPTKDGYFMGAPQVLFYQNESNLLQPIAISISVDDNNIYTPRDKKEAWIFAKLTALNAEVVYMPIIAHVVDSHFWMDPVIVATDTILPSSHPVYQLLYPHFTGNIAINKFAYDLLLKPKGFFDQISVFKYPQIHELISRGLKAFKITNRQPTENFAERAIEGIAYYPYRDDAILLWEAVYDYVKNYLAVFYKNDAEETNDTILAQWRQKVDSELAIKPGMDNASLLAAILFNVFEHNIQQNSILDYFMDPYNNGPLLTHLPTSKEEITEDFLYDSMPDLKGLICRGMLIRTITEQTDRLAPFTSRHPEVNKINELFCQRLEEIEDELIARNKTRIRPYTSAYPSKIDSSIKI